jgi:hypothetical protein
MVTRQLCEFALDLTVYYFHESARATLERNRLKVQCHSISAAQTMLTL